MTSTAKNYKVVIYGLIDSMNFKRAQFCAQKMEVDFPKMFKKPDIVPMFEFEWEEFIEKQKKLLQGEMWIYDKNELVFINDKLLGSYDDLLYWADYNKFYENNLPYTLFSALVEEDYRLELIKRNHDFIYMYISIDDVESGFFLIELFNDILPKTCENFKTLCVGNIPMTRDPEKQLTYENSLFHRIVPNGWIQGGDVFYGRGNDGESIYGGEFEDENFSVPFNKRGILGMANHGRHTNASQFFITLVETPWMNQRYVAFGQLLEGTELLQTLEEQETFNERPVKPIKIQKCETFNFQEPIHCTPLSILSRSIQSIAEGEEGAEEEHTVDEEEKEDIPEDVMDELETTEGVKEDVADITEDAAGASEVAADASEVAVDASEVAADASEAAAYASEVAVDASEVAADESEVAEEAPEVTADASEVAADASEIAVDASEVAADEPEVGVDAPEVAADASEVAVDASETAADEPEVADEAPEVETDAAEVAEDAAEGDDVIEDETDAAEVETDAPEVETDAPEVAEDAPEADDVIEVGADAPEVADDAPEVTTDEQEVADDAPEVETDAPEVADDAPEVADDAPEVVDDAPEVTADEQEAGDDTPEVADDAPEVASDAPEVESDAPEVADNEPSVAADAPGDEVNEPDDVLATHEGVVDVPKDEEEVTLDETEQMSPTEEDSKDA